MRTVPGEDPFSGHLFVFRGRPGHLAKVLWWSGDGYCLFSKRLDRGHFVWPQASAGATVMLSEAQLSMLLEGIDWRRPERTWRPERPGCGATTRAYESAFLLVAGSVSCGVLDPDALPETAEELRALVLEQRTVLRERDGRDFERLKAQLAWLQRRQFGRSSEKIEREIALLELQLKGLEGSSSARTASQSLDRAVAQPVRRPLPDHLPREEIVHEPSCSCPACGGPLRRLGEDVSEMLEYVPARSAQAVVSTLRADRAKRRAIAADRERLGGLLAHVLVAKYADHLPLYRQNTICARGVGALARWRTGSAARVPCCSRWSRRWRRRG